MQGREPLSPEDIDTLCALAGMAPGDIAAMTPYGALACAAATRPEPAVIQVPGGTWWVGHYLPGPEPRAFIQEFMTPIRGYARRLAYGWATPLNGLTDVRRQLRITIAASQS
jgi:hypothetical protein